MAFAVTIGLLLGVLGSGGSIVTLPVLVYIAGVPAEEAVGMSIGDRRSNQSVRRIDPAPARQCGRKGGSDLFNHGHGWSLRRVHRHFVSKRILLLSFAGLMSVVGSLMGWPTHDLPVWEGVRTPYGNT
jgi:hypothetical protein